MNITSAKCVASSLYSYTLRLAPITVVVKFNITKRRVYNADQEEEEVEPTQAVCERKF